MEGVEFAIRELQIAKRKTISFTNKEKYTDPKLSWEKINPYGNTPILKTNALGPKENPKALRFEYTYSPEKFSPKTKLVPGKKVNASEQASRIPVLAFWFFWPTIPQQLPEWLLFRYGGFLLRYNQQ
jgi:hypothetical protein